MKLASKRARALQMLRNKHLANPPKKHDTSLCDAADPQSCRGARAFRRHARSADQARRKSRQRCDLRADRRMLADARANEMIYEHEGVQEPVRLMLRPLLVMQEQLSYVHYVCLQLIEALKRLPDLYLQDERIRKIVAITPDEERWFRDTWTKEHS